MSKLLHTDAAVDNDDANAIAIPRVFSEIAEVNMHDGNALNPLLLEPGSHVLPSLVGTLL